MKNRNEHIDVNKMSDTIIPLHVIQNMGIALIRQTNKHNITVLTHCLQAAFISCSDSTETVHESLSVLCCPWPCFAAGLLRF